MSDKSKNMQLSWIMSGKIDPSLVKATQAVTKNIGEMKKAGASVSKTFSTLASKAASLVKYLSFGVLAGGAPSLLVLAKNAAEAGDKFKEMSERVGLSAKTLSEWSHAANMSGISTESFGGNVLKLNKLMSDAASGNQAAQLAFRRAGVSIKDSSGKLKSADQVMLEMADTFKKMPEGIYKSDLAMALFGKSGSEMVPLLQSGSDAIKDLITQAHEMGMVFSDEEAGASADFCDNLDLLKKSVQGVSYSIGKQLVPIISPLIKATSKWISSNRELITSKVAEWIQKFKDILPQIKVFLLEVYEGVKKFALGVNFVVEAMGGWMPLLKNVSKGLVVLKGTQIAKWVYGASKAVMAFGKSFITLIPIVIKFGAVLMTTPIGWIIAGIAALVGAGYLLWKNWDKVVTWIKDLWSGTKEFFAEKFASITSAFDEGFIQGIMNLVKEFNPLTLIVQAIDGIFNYFTGISLIDEGSKFIKSFGDGILNMWNSIKDGIIDTVTGWIPGWLKKSITSVTNSVSSAFSSTDPTYHYSNGGLVQNRQVAEVGEDGAEMIIPLTKPERGKNLIMKAADMMGISLNSTNNKSDDLIGNMTKGLTASNNSTSLSPSFNPVINIQGSSNTNELKQMLNEVLRQQKDDFIKKFEEYAYNRKRVGVF